MAQLAVPQQVGIFHIFRNRSFALLWSAQFISTIGSALTSLAAGILVFRLTGSSLSVGLMLMATALPTLVVGLVAGVFVDRYDRKKILISSDLVRAGLVALIPFALQFDIIWLYVIVALSAAVTQFFEPAHESVLPDIASDEELAAANSLIAISSFGSTAIGFAASGLIASRFPIEWCFWLDSLTFLLSTVCLVFVAIPKLKVPDTTNVRTVFRNLKDGARFLFGSKILRSIFYLGMITSFSFGLWNVLLLPMSTKVLGATEFEYGLQEGLTSVGFVFGSLMMARLADRLREGQWLVIGYLGMGVAGIFYALAQSIPVAIVLVMLSGFLNAPTSVGQRLIAQRNTTREVRGRVFSVIAVRRDIFLLIGMGAAGLADVVGVREMTLFASVLLVGVGLLALVLPGLGQPAAEWKRAISLLRGVGSAPGLPPPRPATMADFELLLVQLPLLSALTGEERAGLVSHATVMEAPVGAAVVRQGDTSDQAYFILSGRAVAGRHEGDDYRVLETLNAGDIFGEIAALTGSPRVADVVTEEHARLMQVPSKSLRELMRDQAINRLLLSKVTERLSRTFVSDLPRLAGTDQKSLRELRSESPQIQPA